MSLQEVPDLVQHILDELEASNEYLAESVGQVSVCVCVCVCFKTNFSS